MADLQKYNSLDPLARGLLFQKIKKKEGISYQEMARKIKKSPAYVVNSVRLLDLPIAVKDGLWGQLISEGHARALAAIKDQKDCVDIYKEVLKAHASVREAEEMVRQKLKLSKPSLDQKKIQAIKEKLEKIIKAKIQRIKVKESRQKIQIEVYKD